LPWPLRLVATDFGWRVGCGPVVSKLTSFTRRASPSHVSIGGRRPTGWTPSCSSELSSAGRAGNRIIAVSVGAALSSRPRYVLYRVPPHEGHHRCPFSAQCVVGPQLPCQWPTTRLVRRTPVLNFVWIYRLNPPGSRPCFASRSQDRCGTSRAAPATWQPPAVARLPVHVPGAHDRPRRHCHVASGLAVTDL
jgi:hypothetical protein